MPLPPSALNGYTASIYESSIVRVVPAALPNKTPLKASWSITTFFKVTFEFLLTCIAESHVLNVPPTNVSFSKVTLEPCGTVTTALPLYPLWGVPFASNLTPL